MPNGIADRKLVSQVSKAIPLNGEALERIADPYLRASLLLQREFGLRREEPIKFIPPLRRPRGPDCVESHLDQEGQRAGDAGEDRKPAGSFDRSAPGSRLRILDPPNRNYDAQRRVYEAQTSKASLSKMHGLRHEYAQRRYAKLIGWEAPVRGGPSCRDLTVEQKRIDHEARLTISHELGYERIQVTAIYCG